ncbi:GerAB/ArcD/ProY family transporter [Ectobacillus ponti]|uniref:GerAB/ArcD/ProY family transporter n=1 Tax=Ectobacillus ponti TaxID=2961894 RepID=A0AA41X5Y1_9BACI|nr:GerAB/ArcD/ProY family transporter [Ectobacillus ponti]MCP8967249.1 GerAB/ArcD/ProY family transporter [Ectobacillus ponti]
MTRYFYYIILMNMLSNILLFTPTVLTADRFHGASSAILLALPLGMLMLLLFSKSLAKFPGKGLPEILDEHLPRWFSQCIKLYLGGMWLLAGSLVILAITSIVRRFLNPDISRVGIILLFTIIIVFVAQRPSSSILYGTEIILMFVSPALFFIIFKSLREEHLDWFAIRRMSDYIWQVPSFASLAASTYVFTGYLKMAVFNRSLHDGIQLKYAWAIPVVAAFNLATTFLIPIGMLGIDGVGYYIYPWISTADSMRMELGVMERVLYTFLALYAFLAFLQASIKWHVALEFVKSILPRKWQEDMQSETRNWKNWLPTGILVLFTASAFLIEKQLNELQTISFARTWHEVRLVSEMGLVLLIWWISRRKAVQ